jgi:O-antigen/teichoic acid export membrane protein
VNKLAHNTLHSAAAGLSIVLGGFLSNVLIARMLGVEASGIVAFATWAITVGVMLGDLGAPGTLARYLPDLQARKSDMAAQGLVRWLSRLNVAAAATVACGFAGYAVWVWLDRPAGFGRFRDGPWFWLLIACACLGQTLAAFVYGYLKGMQRFAILAKLATVSALFQIAATFTGGTMFGVPGALTGVIAGGILPALLLRRILRARGSVPLELKRRVRRFALESWASYLVTAFAWTRMEILFLEMSWGSHAVALFAASVTLANVATQGPLLLTGGLLPHLSSQADSGSGQPQATYAASIRLLAFLLFPACLGAAAIAPSLVPAIYGREFAGAVPSTVVLLCGAAITASCSVAFTYMLAMERTRFVFVTGGVAALCVITAGLTLIPSYGVMAAAIARTVIQTAVSIATVWYLGRHLNCPTPVSSLLRIFAAAVSCAVAAWLCIWFIPGPIGMAVAVIVGAVVYGLGVRLLKALPQGDVERLLTALTILPRSIRVPAAGTLRLIAAYPYRENRRSAFPSASR